MVLIEGPEHVEQMMQALKGRKKCDMYIVRNGPPSIDSYGYHGYYGMAEEEVAYVEKFLHILQKNLYIPSMLIVMIFHAFVHDLWGEASEASGTRRKMGHHHRRSNLN
jgi:hypothetical protein